MRRFERGRRRRVGLGMLLLLTPLLLAACSVPAAPALRQGTADFSGGELATHVWNEIYSYNFFGGCPFYAGRMRAVPAGTLLVGGDNFFNGGSGPFPCIHKDDYAYRGGVRFDLSSLTSLTRIVIQKAVLSWTIERAVVRDANGNPSGVASGRDVTNCVGAVLESTKSIFTQNSFLPGRSLRAGQGDVTSLVTTWIVDKAPNFGFVLVGPDESYIRNNAACLNTITNVNLHIDFLTP